MKKKDNKRHKSTLSRWWLLSAARWCHMSHLSWNKCVPWEKCHSVHQEGWLAPKLTRSEPYGLLHLEPVKYKSLFRDTNAIHHWRIKRTHHWGMEWTLFGKNENWHHFVEEAASACHCGWWWQQRTSPPLTV